MSNINKTILNRKSEIAFEPKPITQEQISLLFEAARWAPSSYNEQPWRFYIASRANMAAFESMLSILAPGNQEWAKNASLLIISTAKKNVTRNETENFYALHDTALAEANLVFQAESMGFSTHIMGGFDKNFAKQALSIPDDFIPVAAIAVGYKGTIDNLSPSNRERATAERVRKRIDEILVEVK
ncbi:MAG TPA: nitroreductase family protein [Tenuifilaceae bacterium]|nr:nitroreductase family protein [Tenuifilaceae bacterium]HPE19072.1 nitroreductase family protein [Tenuifilaceae bacterium]HPJ46530.1 nitroreductase family protein [Tenuifilaceae bacterium]HPQ34922.1 nitroreductase family protein [Tenuifilaceae bacterium]HRX68851.1 nitroreductase family protein [Tenuifilaceae bacterium]